MPKLNDLLILALSKAVSNDAVKAAKKAVLPGEYTVDTTLLLQGDLKLGAEYEQVIATKVPWENIVAVLLSKLNKVTLDSVIKEALDMTDGDDEVSEIKRRAKATVARLKGKCSTLCSGKLSAKVTASLVAPLASTRKAS